MPQYGKPKSSPKIKATQPKSGGRLSTMYAKMKGSKS